MIPEYDIGIHPPFIKDIASSIQSINEDYISFFHLYYFLPLCCLHFDHIALSCSVGGTDYGSVRIGAFMGRKMIKSAANALLSQSPNNTPSQEVDEVNSDENDESEMNLFEAEAELDYLCNLTTHRYTHLLEHVVSSILLQRYSC